MLSKRQQAFYSSGRLASETVCNGVSGLCDEGDCSSFIQESSRFTQVVDGEYASPFLAGMCDPPEVPEHHQMAFLLSGGQREGLPR